MITSTEQNKKIASAINEYCYDNGINGPFEKTLDIEDDLDVKVSGYVTWTSNPGGVDEYGQEEESYDLKIFITDMSVVKYASDQCNFSKYPMSEALKKEIRSYDIAV